MNSIQAVNRALGAAHAMLAFDQSGSATAHREADKYALIVLRSYVDYHTKVGGIPRNEVLVELIKSAATLEEQDDRKGILRLISELEEP